MDIAGIAAKLERLDPRVARAAERVIGKVPALRERLDREYDRMLAGMQDAVKPYRRPAAAAGRRRVTRPQVVAPTSAHVAFDKAAQYFGIELVRVPVGPDFRADVEATRRALTRNTIALVGSAPGFPYGVIDPIEDLAAL